MSNKRRLGRPVTGALHRGSWRGEGRRPRAGDSAAAGGTTPAEVGVSGRVQEPSPGPAPPARTWNVLEPKPNAHGEGVWCMTAPSGAYADRAITPPPKRSGRGECEPQRRSSQHCAQRDLTPFSHFHIFAPMCSHCTREPVSAVLTVGKTPRYSHETQPHAPISLRS